MPQPIKKNSKNVVKVVKQKAKLKPKSPPQQKRKRKHPEYGTSKLEQRFIKDFLEKLNIKYVYQYKMESIGRYADFYLPDYQVLIEIDGDYYHGYGLQFEEKSPMQKKNARVDHQKDRWALMNGIPMIRIWEHDINKHPEKVIEMLQRRLKIESGKKKTARQPKRRIL